MIGSILHYHCGSGVICTLVGSIAVKMRYPDGLRGLVSKTKTHMVTLAVGSEVVFQGGVSQSDMATILKMIGKHSEEWDAKVASLPKEESDNGTGTTTTPGTTIPTGPKPGAEKLPVESTKSDKPVAYPSKK